MSLLTFDLVAATLAAFGVGLTVRGPSRLKLGLSVVVAIAGWGLRALSILKGDATVAGDYFNGLNVGTGVVELAVAFAWTGLWCALGTLAARIMRHRKRDAQ